METTENNQTVQTEQPQKKHQLRKTAGQNASAWSKFVSWLKDPASDFVLFVILLILINLVSIRAFARLDLTGPKSYSLSDASRQVVKTIEEPLSIKVFFSPNLPAPYSNVDQYVRDILVEYKNSANKNFSYEYFDMNKPANQQLAQGYGLQQIQIQEVKNNEVGLKSAYMGIVFVYADQIEKLDGLTTSDGLEYKITTTISKIVSSANILTGLSGNVELTLYKSTALARFNIGGYDQVDSSVKKAYDAVNKKNMGRIDFQEIDPPSAEVSTICQKYGIQAVNWKNDDGSIGYGTIGLVLEYNGNFRVVPMQLVNMIFSYGVSGLDKLEDSMNESLQSLVSRTSKIGYLTGNGEVELDDEQNGAANFKGLVDDIYSLEPLDLEKDDIPVDMQSIIVNGPKTAFGDAALYKLDQFIMRGGNVMFFMDPYNVQQPQGQNAYYQQPQYIPIRTGLEKLLSKYGVECGTNYVMDEKCYTTMQQQYGKLTLYYAPMMTGKSIDKKHPTTRNLNNLIFVQAGSLDVTNAQANGDEKVTVLAKSSPSSWTMSDNIVLNPMYIQPPADKSTEKAENLAVLIEGTFQSAYDKAPETDTASGNTSAKKPDDALTTSSHLAKSTQRGKVFVASSSYLTTPMLISQNSSEPIALFLRNVVDYMNGNADLCTMRTKGLSMNTLDKTNGAFANVAKYFNQFGLAVLVAVVGLLVLLARQQHRKQIRLRYDPSDSREMSRSKKEESK